MYYTNSRVLIKSTRVFFGVSHMKSRLLIFTIIIAVIISILILPAAADNHVIDISRPEGNEVVTKEIFSIFGTCVYDETTISFEYYDEEIGDYKPLKATDGKSTFKVGNGKMFGKDIKLKMGLNDIKITAYTNTKESKDEPEEFYFTITLVEDKKNSNWFQDAINWIKDGGKDESSEKKE